jgi:hypothetical protein|tara:strand:+ start:298 stop:537 length:240 start_codon:yes stop_codon:yes gene_type:complete
MKTLSKSMTTQEENWELMTVLGVPWKETTELSDSDRAFLLSKATLVKEQALKQQELEMKLEAEAFQQRVASNAPTVGTT